METIFSEKNEPSAFCLYHRKRRWFIAAATLTLVKIPFIFTTNKENKEEPAEKEKCCFLEENMRNYDNAVSY